MKRSYTITLAAMAIAVASMTAFAQVPRTISYQGLLTDGSGNFISDGNHTLVLKLYDNVGASSPIYSETQTVAVIKGLFNVIIGSASPIPPSVAFDRAYYLGVSVDGGSELAPRTPLTAVPYALRAAVADKAMSVDPSATGMITTIQSTDGSMQITNANGPTTTVNIATLGVTNDKIGPAAVTQEKISSGSATAGQVLVADGGGGASWGSGGGGGGLTLPYAQSVNNAADLFALTNTGTGRAGYFRNQSTTANQSALYGEMNNSSPSATVAGVEGKSANGFGVIGRGGPSSSAIFGLTITGPTSGSFYAGTGVSGFSDAGHGVAGVTYSNSSSGIYGFANGSGVGVTGRSTAGNAGLFDITNASNSNHALEGSTNGAGAGVYGLNSATTGSTWGVLGEASSTSHGTGATGGVSGVIGRVTPTSPGGYSAGVRGLNNGTSGTGIGVIGYQAGSGWGVYGETPSGFGVYGLTTNNSAASSGVRGETFSTNGIGVEAKYSGTGVGVALELDNGAIRVAGTNKAAFVHTATVANKLSANGTDIDNAMCNGDANCILIVTQKLNPSNITYNNSPIGVYYNTVRNKWEIFNENNAAIPTNAQFNVLVIKQ